MKAIALFLVIFGVILLDIGRRGRVKDIGTDLSDAFFALISQDPDALGEVLAREGEDLSATESDLEKWNQVGDVALSAAAAVKAAGVGSAGENVGASVGRAASGLLLNECVRLGTAAKGYRWTATGPDYYDCSGLVWRACKNLGIYTGPRFTTSTVSSIKGFNRVTTPSVGDIVVWPGDHMGVVAGDNRYYSARSRKSGIGYSTITGHGGTPRYLRPGS